VSRADGYIPVCDVITRILGTCDGHWITIRVLDIAAAVMLVTDGIPVIVLIILEWHHVGSRREGERAGNRRGLPVQDLNRSRVTGALLGHEVRMDDSAVQTVHGVCQTAVAPLPEPLLSGGRIDGHDRKDNK